MRDIISNPEFSARADGIYTYHGQTFIGPKQFHFDKDRIRDIGEAPRFENARILLGKKFRYFGNQGQQIDKSESAATVRLLNSLTEGHRVHHNAALRQELEEFERQVWRKRGVGSTAAMAASDVRDCREGRERSAEVC